MTEARDCLGLFSESLDLLTVGSIAAEDHFQGDKSVQLVVARLVNDAHPAPAQFAQDLVTTNFRTFSIRRRLGAVLVEFCRAVGLHRIGSVVAAIRPVAQRLRGWRLSRQNWRRRRRIRASGPSLED